MYVTDENVQEEISISRSTLPALKLRHFFFFFFLLALLRYWLKRVGGGVIRAKKVNVGRKRNCFLFSVFITRNGGK